MNLWWGLVLLAFGLVDESYALTISRYLQGKGSREFFLAVNLGLYASWVLSALVGGLLEYTLSNPPGQRKNAGDGSSVRQRTCRWMVIGTIFNYQRGG